VYIFKCVKRLYCIYLLVVSNNVAISAHSFRATSLLWYCLSCTSHKLLLSWTKLINVSQSVMIYVIIGRKKQTELNSTDLRPTSVVIGRQVGCIETKHVSSSWFEKIGRIRPTSIVGRIGRCRRHSDRSLSFLLVWRAELQFVCIAWSTTAVVRILTAGSGSRR
jgi:hypothetical protein